MGERAVATVLSKSATAMSAGMTRPLVGRRLHARRILPLIRSIKFSFLSIQMFWYVYEKSKAAAGPSPSASSGSPVSPSGSSVPNTSDVSGCEYSISRMRSMADAV